MAAILFFSCFVPEIQHALASKEDFSRAFVTVSVNEKEFSAVLPFVTEGSFSRAGVLENAEGHLCMIDKDFLLNYNQSKKKSWIGIIHEDKSESFETDRDNRGNRKSDDKHDNDIESKSLSDKIKDVIFLGASALIILAKNVRVGKEFDVAQMFSKPIIFLHGVENVTKILQLFALQYNLYGKIQKNMSNSIANTIGTVTLWAACGRSTSGSYSEWQGVVCIGNGHRSSISMDEYVSAMAWNALFLFLVCFMIYLHIILSRSGIEELDDFEEESGNHHILLARQIISRMKIEIYRSNGRTSCKKSKKRTSECNTKKFENAPQQCAVCLDIFFPLQRLRVLPCKHCFHQNCIDRWLLERHTCPMCKFNILEADLNRERTESQ